jgi:hypothetical protein
VAGAPRLDTRPAGAPPWLVRCAATEPDGSLVHFAPTALTPGEDGRSRTVVDVAVAPGGGAGLVVFRRAAWPGLVARLDGRPVPIETANLALPAVRLPPGSRGRLELTYAPRGLRAGALAAAGALAVALFVLRRARAPRLS